MRTLSFLCSQSSLLLIAVAALLYAACGTPAAAPAPAPAAEGAAPAAAPTGSLQGLKPVAVYIVDDFGQLTPRNFLDGILVGAGQQCKFCDNNFAPVPIKSTDNCVLTADGQTFSARGATLVAESEPHGFYVLDAARTALQQHGASLLGEHPNLDSGQPPLQLWVLPSETTPGGDAVSILLVPVSLPGFVTEGLGDRIAGVTQWLQEEIGASRLTTPTSSATTYAISHLAGVVLNMSFAIVPCDPGAFVPSLPPLTSLVALDEQGQLQSADVEFFLDTMNTNLIDVFTPANTKTPFLPEAAPTPVPDLSFLDGINIESASDLVQYEFPGLVNLDAMRWVEVFTVDATPPMTCNGVTLSEYLADVGEKFDNFRSAVSDSTLDPSATALVDNGLGIVSDAQLLTAYGIGIARPVFDDPFRSSLIELTSSQQFPTIPVAAAGNMGCGFPFAPALWPGVVSVSADSGNADRQFNLGEVSPGQVAKGTSLATPMISVNEAIYLALTGQTTCDGWLPPLNDDQWNNLSAQSKCKSFPQ